MPVDFAVQGHCAIEQLRVVADDSDGGGRLRLVLDVFTGQRGLQLDLLLVMRYVGVRLLVERLFLEVRGIGLNY